jgi:hypothetical protein
MSALLMCAVESNPQLRTLFAIVLSFLKNNAAMQFYLMELTELTTAFLRLDDGLVAGPKELFLPDGLHQSCASQHLARIVMDANSAKATTCLKNTFSSHLHPPQVRCCEDASRFFPTKQSH